MDTRRFDTGQVLAMGIIDKPAPKTDIPEGRENVDPREDGDATEALEAGKLLYIPEYYGCVAAWKDDAGYHGRLLQYRSVTEAPDFKGAAECISWFTETVSNVTG